MGTGDQPNKQLMIMFKDNSLFVELYPSHSFPSPRIDIPNRFRHLIAERKWPADTDDDTCYGLRIFYAGAQRHSA